MTSAPVSPRPTSVLPVQTPSPASTATGRPGPVWPLLSGALAPAVAGGGEPAVLDCGGGSGSVAVPLAQTRAVVTVVDISADALATLSRRAADVGVGERVEAVQGDIEGLDELLDGREFDLVLAHGILAAVDDPTVAFAAMARRVRPGGTLSVLVANPVASVLARAMGGDFPAALAELHDLTAGRVPAGPAAVRRLCAEHGLDLVAEHGVGVFGDLVPGRVQDAPGAREALERLEADSAAHPPFRDIAARVHLLACRTGS